MTRVGQPSPASEVSDEEDFRFHDFHDHPLLTPNSLQGALKKLGVSPIGDIEEVNLIMDNGNVVHFSHPKVQASIPSNTYVVSGHSETKKLADMLPGIMNQLGVENVGQLKNIHQSMGGKADAALPETEDFE